MRVDARLMQTFTAETMKRAGLGRRTFRLARDAAHEPIVEVWKSKLTNAQARAMDGNALWSAFYAELGALPDRANSLDVAVMSMSQYQPATKTTLAHTALGGGRLGLFGSGTLYAHAASLEEVPQKFADATPGRHHPRPATTAPAAAASGPTTPPAWARPNTRWATASACPTPPTARASWPGPSTSFNRTFAITEPRGRTGTGLSPDPAQQRVRHRPQQRRPPALPPLAGPHRRHLPGQPAAHHHRRRHRHHASPAPPASATSSTWSTAKAPPTTST